MKLVFAATALLAAIVSSAAPSLAAQEVATRLAPANGSASVLVGEPVVWRIVADGTSISDKVQLGPEWALLETTELEVAPGAQGARCAREWRLMPLSGGELFTPEVAVTMADGSVAMAPSERIEVSAALPEDAEGPLPTRGMGTAPDRRVGDPRPAIYALFGLLALVAASLLIGRKKRRPDGGDSAEAPPMTPRQSIDALEGPSGLAATPRETMAALGPLFRRAIDVSVDPKTRVRRAALTDDDWASEVEGQGGADAAALVRELSAIRYGGGEPTTFAAKDALTRARATLDAGMRSAEDAALPSVDAPSGASMSAALLLPLQEAVRSTAEGRWSLFGVSFADPWFLLLIPVGLYLTWRGSEGRRIAPARVPTIGDDSFRGSRSLATRLIWVPPFVRALSVVLLAIGLSRPLEGRVSTSKETEGIDMVLLLDTSSSMDQREKPRGPRRFDIVRDVVADFATRRMTDEENARDNVALFRFAFYPDLLVPFTLDADALVGALSSIDVETVQSLDGTAIGQGLTAAVGLLRGSEADSRVAVLLTDGEETVNEVTPMDAAKAALEANVRVYTVYAGPRELLIRDPFGGVRRQRARVGELPQIAELTGGRFFHAESKKELEEAYAAIEELERTPRSEERFAERYDLYPFFVAPGFLLYLLAWLLGSTLGRRLP